MMAIKIEKCAYYFLIFLIGLIVVVKIGAVPVLYLKNISPSPIQDPLEYRNLALNLLAGNGFSIAEDPPYLLDLFRTPLYPLFLAATFLVNFSGHLAILLQQLMIIFSAWLLFKILRRSKFGDSRIIPLIPSLFLLIDPRIWFWSLETMTEPLFIFLTALMFFFLLHPDNFRMPHAAISGVLFGLALLTRPSGLLWAPGIFLFFLFLKKPLKSKLLMFLVFAVISVFVVSPWLWRNFQLVSRPILSSAEMLNYIQAFGMGREDPAWSCAGKITDSKDRKGCVFYGWTSAGFSEAEKTYEDLRSSLPPSSLIKKNIVGAYHFWSSVDYGDAISILYNALYGSGQFLSGGWILLTKISHQLYNSFLGLILISAVLGIIYLYKKKELSLAGLSLGVIIASMFINFGLASTRLHLVLFPLVFLLAGFGVYFIKSIYPAKKKL